MTNLDRLVGTDLLVQGFAEFVESWISLLKKNGVVTETFGKHSEGWKAPAPIPPGLQLIYDYYSAGVPLHGDPSLIAPATRIDGPYVRFGSSIIRQLGTLQGREKRFHLAVKIFGKWNHLNIDPDLFFVDAFLSEAFFWNPSVVLKNGSDCEHCWKALKAEATVIWTGRFTIGSNERERAFAEVEPEEERDLFYLMSWGEHKDHTVLWHPAGRLMYETRYSEWIDRTMALSSFEDHDALLKSGSRRKSKRWDGQICDHVFAPLSQFESLCRNGREADYFRGPRRDGSSA